jgi:putative peptidoglycan lipid II flippase
VWFRVRYDGDAFVLAARMVAPFALYLLALATKTFFAALLNADHRYVPFPVASALGAAVTIGVIAAGRHELGVLSVPIGSLCGELTAIALLASVALGAAGMKMRLTLARPEPVRRFAKLVASEVGGSAVTRINPVVDQLMAGLAGVVGGGTMLRLTGDVSSLPTSLLQAALLPVLLSHLADDFAAGRSDTLRATVRHALASVGAILVASALLLYFVRAPLLRLLFAHGAMDAGGVERMIRLFPYHLVGLPAFGALLVLARAHVAIKNSGIMIGMGALNATLNAVFNVVLLKAIGLEGIALSTSCVYVVIAIVFWVRLDAKLAPREARS